jgi:hypothetical protein
MTIEGNLGKSMRPYLKSKGDRGCVVPLPLTTRAPQLGL